MNNDWEPTESDCQWMLMTLNSLTIGGQWRPSFGIYERTAEQTLTLIAKVYTPQNKAEENIARTKKAVEAIGWTYIESGQLLNILMPYVPTELMRDGKDVIAYSGDKQIRLRLTKCKRCGFWRNEKELPVCPQCKI